MLDARDGRTEQLKLNGKLLLQAYYTVFFSNTLKRPNSEEMECKIKKKKKPILKSSQF